MPEVIPDKVMETYVVLKYGSLNRAYHKMCNRLDKLGDDYALLNEFFGKRSLLDRLVDNQK